jgi:hypothetical protein
MMKPVYSFAASAVLIAAALTGCRAEGGAEEPGARAQSDGRVVNTAPSWRAGEAWTIAATPSIVIGGSDADSSADLHSVAGAVRLSDGRIVIADRGAHGLRVYDPQGRHLLTAGGRGDGPGEFRGVDGLARIRGDTLLVWDRNSSRLSVFDPAGRFVGSHRPDGLNALPWFAGAFQDGSYVVSTGVSPAQMMAQSGSTRQDTLVMLRVGREGEILDTIGRFAGPEMFADVSGGSMTVERVIFGEGSSLAVGADRLFAGLNTRYEVSAYTPAGERAMTIVKTETRRSASPGDVEEYRQFLANRDLGNVPPEVRASAARRVAAIPHRSPLPSFGEIRVDQLGYVWVAQFRLPGQPAEWDIFDASGVWAGSLRVPDGLEIHEIGADYLLGVATDELGVERVDLYPLQREK